MSDPAPRAETQPETLPMPASQPIFLRALRWSVVATLLLVLVCGGIGWLSVGSRGLLGGVIGAAIGGVLLGLTVASIAFANRFIASPSYIVVFFVIVLGSWLLKFIGFIVAAVLLRDQPWLHPVVLFVSIVAGVLVSLVIDLVVVVKSRIPYVAA